MKQEIHGDPMSVLVNCRTEFLSEVRLPRCFCSFVMCWHSYALIVSTNQACWKMCRGKNWLEMPRLQRTKKTQSKAGEDRRDFRTS